MPYSRSFSFVVVVRLVAALCAGIAAVPATAQIGPSTMQFRYNAQHSGDYSPVAGSNTSIGNLTWSYTTGSAVFSSPAVSNLVVYVGSNDRNVYAIDNEAVATSQGTPGFDALLAFVGLVIAAYVVRRRG